MVDWRLPLDLEPGPHLRLDSRVNGGFDPSRLGLEHGQLQVLDRFPGSLDRVQRGLFVGDRTPRGANDLFAGEPGGCRSDMSRLTEIPLHNGVFSLSGVTDGVRPYPDLIPHALLPVHCREVGLLYPLH